MTGQLTLNAYSIHAWCSMFFFYYYCRGEEGIGRAAHNVSKTSFISLSLSLSLSILVPRAYKMAQNDLMALFSRNSSTIQLSLYTRKTKQAFLRTPAHPSWSICCNSLFSFSRRNLSLSCFHPSSRFRTTTVSTMSPNRITTPSITKKAWRPDESLVPSVNQKIQKLLRKKWCQET